MARKNIAIRWGSNAIGVVCSAIVRLLGGWYEWETQTTEPDGCWRTWSAGFASLDDAMASLLADRAKGQRWNPHMPDEDVKWRVECRIVWTRYYEPNKGLAKKPIND
jgi:hypothetical protein